MRLVLKSDKSNMSGKRLTFLIEVVCPLNPLLARLCAPFRKRLSQRSYLMEILDHRALRTLDFIKLWFDRAEKICLEELSMR